MFQKYFFICNYLLIIAVGLYHFKKLKHSRLLVLFYVFLLYSLLTEILGTFVVFTLRINSAIIYNTWNTINFLFYSLFFLSLINNQLKRILIKIFITIGIVLLIVNASFFQNYTIDVFNYNSVLSKIFLVITMMFYFGELLKSDFILTLKNSLFFWISIGALVYNIGFIPVFVVGKYINYLVAFTYVAFGLNILMAGFFITGFIVSKKEFNK